MTDIVDELRGLASIGVVAVVAVAKLDEAAAEIERLRTDRDHLLEEARKDTVAMNGVAEQIEDQNDEIEQLRAAITPVARAIHAVADGRTDRITLLQIDIERILAASYGVHDTPPSARVETR